MSPTITLELRKWRKVGLKYVIGQVFNDRNGNYFDGEEGNFGIITWVESTNYVLVYSVYGVLKLDKDEEDGKEKNRRR